MQTIILSSPAKRAEAKRIIDVAPVNAVAKVGLPSRTNEQNDLMWAMLSDISRAKPEGRNWTPETWKAAFMHALGHQVQFCEGLEGSGPFPLGFRSSRLTKRQMSDLIESIHAYAARHGVELEHVSGGPCAGA